jgi:hypothetical protein
MRSKREILYLNYKDLTEEEREKLSDWEFNCCDLCGEIDQSEKLNWIDGEDFYDSTTAINAVKEGNIALCDTCWETKQKVHCGQPVNVLEDLLDWYNEAPSPEMDAVEDAIERRFPYYDVVQAIVLGTGKDFPQVEEESRKRVAKKEQENG